MVRRLLANREGVAVVIGETGTGKTFAIVAAAEGWAQAEAEVADMPAPGEAARREFAVANRVLAERQELAITAARISPPTYIRNELGERPSDPTKRQAWDRGVAQIESYRQRHGVMDQSKAFDPESKQGAERARQQQAMRRLQQKQKTLGLGQHAARARSLGRGLRIGR